MRPPPVAGGRKRFRSGSGTSHTGKGPGGRSARCPPSSPRDSYANFRAVIGCPRGRGGAGRVSHGASQKEPRALPAALPGCLGSLTTSEWCLPRTGPSPRGDAIPALPGSGRAAGGAGSAFVQPAAPAAVPTPLCLPSPTRARFPRAAAAAVRVHGFPISGAAWVVKRVVDAAVPLVKSI